MEPQTDRAQRPNQYRNQGRCSQEAKKANLGSLRIHSSLTEPLKFNFARIQFVGRRQSMMSGFNRNSQLTISDSLG